MKFWKKLPLTEALSEYPQYRYSFEKDAWISPEDIIITDRTFSELPSRVSSLDDPLVSWLPREMVVILYEYVELKTSGEVLGEMLSSL